MCFFLFNVFQSNDVSSGWKRIFYFRTRAHFVLALYEPRPTSSHIYVRQTRPNEWGSSAMATMQSCRKYAEWNFHSQSCKKNNKQNTKLARVCNVCAKRRKCFLVEHFDIEATTTRCVYLYCTKYHEKKWSWWENEGRWGDYWVFPWSDRINDVKS